MIDTIDYDYGNIEASNNLQVGGGQRQTLSRRQSQHIRFQLDTMKDEMRANKLTEFLSETTRRVSVDEILPQAHWIWYVLSILFWAVISAAGIVYSILFVDPIYKDGIIYGGILFVISVGSII